MLASPDIEGQGYPEENKFFEGGFRIFFWKDRPSATPVPQSPPYPTLGGVLNCLVDIFFEILWTTHSPSIPIKNLHIFSSTGRGEHMPHVSSHTWGKIRNSEFFRTRYLGILISSNTILSLEMPSGDMIRRFIDFWGQWIQFWSSCLDITKSNQLFWNLKSDYHHEE